MVASLKNAGRIRCFFGTFSSSSAPVHKRADRFSRDFLQIGRFSDGYERHGLWEEGFVLSVQHAKIQEFVNIS